jgi:hypothetical protein
MQGGSRLVLRLAALLLVMCHFCWLVFLFCRGMSLCNAAGSMKQCDSVSRCFFEQV